MRRTKENYRVWTSFRMHRVWWSMPLSHISLSICLAWLITRVLGRTPGTQTDVSPSPPSPRHRLSTGRSRTLASGCGRLECDSRKSQSLVKHGSDKTRPCFSDVKHRLIKAEVVVSNNTRSDSAWEWHSLRASR